MLSTYQGFLEAESRLALTSLLPESSHGAFLSKLDFTVKALMNSDSLNLNEFEMKTDRNVKGWPIALA